MTGPATTTDGAAPPRDPASAPDAAPSPASVPHLVQDVLKWTETVAVPVGALSGLLLFFGWSYSRAYFGYFGIDQRLLQYSVQDQVLLSADVMFGTAVLVLAVVLALVLLDRLTTRVALRPDRLGRGARVATPVAGIVLLGVGLVAALRLPGLPTILPLRAGAIVFMAGAVIMLSVGARRGRRSGRAVLVAALLLAAFWITTLDAENEGTVIARQIDDAPAHLPLVTLYSEKYLDLPGPAVEFTQETSPTGAPLYRYGGLRLLTYSNDRWFLLTGRYDGYRSTVAVLLNDGSVRADVARQSQE